MEMEQEVMKALLEAFEQSDWQEMTVTIGGDRLHVSRQSSNGNAPEQPAPPAGAAAPAAPAFSSAPSSTAAAAVEPAPDPAPPAPPSEPLPSSAAVAPPPDGTTVNSPSVGLFWRAPSPGAPPFVEVGGPVAAGDTVAIVEVMKLMNHVTAPVSGTVLAVLPENGEAVEFGQVLVVIDPES
jgi:acetyl-CoA carboxylase biotin carboxyl carrier protein